MYNDAKRQMRRQLLITIFILSFLILGTLAVILYGKGYRFGLNEGRLDFAGTGLLVATSTPDGARVFVNGHLTTATDNTINLSPGDYSVKISKDGYFPWEKKLKIQKELVSKADALLFPNAPKLESITNIGIRNSVLDPSLTKIAFAVASQSARKNGIYILDLSTRPILTLQSSSSQIVDDTLDLFSQSSFAWSPDGEELMATVSGTQTSYLIDTDRFNESPNDVTATLSSVVVSWQKELDEKEKARLDALSKKLREVVRENFKIPQWSLDDSKILYEAGKSGELPIVISPRLLGSDTIPEERKIEKGAIYVYDIREDKNFKILGSLSADRKLQWFPDSKHLIDVHDKKIEIVEHDGGNRTTIYAGPFLDNFVFPWSDPSKIVILTNLGNPNIDPNLYTIVLK